MNDVRGAIVLTPELIRRYDKSGPRYTSYPTADRFHDGVGPAQAEAALARANRDRPGEPLSVYMHLPFCQSLCTYCGCSVVITRNPTKLDVYLEHLLREITMVAERLPERRAVAQLHLGGGTPNYYSVEQLGILLDHLREHFDLLEDAEIAIETDPRQSSPEVLAGLKEIGFNRVSMGVQDLNPQVQEAVRRVHGPEHVAALLTAAREVGFESVNMDLIYGLPHQSPESFARTMERVLAMAPDRVALYSFAYVPWARRQQQAIDVATLPPPDDKLQIFCDSRQAFLDAGYVPIGMDHFAKPDDELAVALGQGRLRRNFQGYTAMPQAYEVVGLGMTAIGDIGEAYLHNVKDLKAYYAAIDAGQLAVHRGWELSEDDLVRRSVIHELMCNFRLDLGALRARFDRGLADFPAALTELRELADEGLVEITDEALEVTALGQLFVRNVAMVFDQHLRTVGTDRPTYSRTV